MATRREKVVLELEDRFTTGMARAAASAALLNKELDSLSRESVRTRRSLSDIDQPAQRFGRTAGSSSREVDKLSGRMRILADVAAVLGPALIPIGAVGVPAVTGLASQLGFAAGAAGTAVLAFQGVGTALKTLNAAALDPTQENLAKAQVALESLSPAAQGFVTEIGHMLPELKRLRDTAAEGLFPGLTEGLDALESGLPRVQNIIGAVATELGSISGDVGRSLASDRWAPFLAFVEREAPLALADMAKAAGSTAHAVASLWVATAPLNEDFSKWLVDATADIDRWATSLSKTQGFADFLAYVQETGPKVADAFAAIATAVIQILEAAAPLGGPVLVGVKALADLVSAIADSDLGTPLFTAVAALSLFNRTLAITRTIGGTAFGGMVANELKASAGIRTITADLRVLQRQSSLVTLPGKNFIGPLTQAQTAATRLKTTLPALGKTAALITGIGVASSGAADKIGLTNTASLALMGTFIAPGIGTALGGAAGLLVDLSHAGNDAEGSVNRLNAATRSFDATGMSAGIKDVKKQLDDLQNTSGTKDFISDRLKDVGFGLRHPLALHDNRESNAKAAIAAAENETEARRAAAAQAILADGFLATAHGADTASQSTQDFQRSLEKLNAVLTGRASLRDYEQALDDFTKRQTERAKVLDQIRTENADFAARIAKTDRELSAARKSGNKDQIANLQAQRAEEARAHNVRLKELNSEADTLKNSLNIDKQAGRDTQEALDNIASTALKVAATLSGRQRSEFLAGARTDFVKAAIAAGMAKDAAQELADKVLGLSQIKGQPKIVIDADGAWRVIDVTARRLERLTRRTYRLNITAQAANVHAALNDIRTPADGETIPGPRYPYRDQVFALLAPGEEVISNRFGQADRHRELLKAINANRYADGGTVVPIRSGSGGVSPMPMSSGLSDGDISRIVRGLATIRPLAGHMTVMPHDYDAFRRQEQAVRRAAGVGGMPS